jgi:Carboxypeptidase regulatory-like domain/TonB-dependent Receptor Plug Domain
MQAAFQRFASVHPSSFLVWNEAIMSHYPWARVGAAVLVLLMFLLPARGWAAAYGAVSGIVRDDNDRPVAGAKVVLESATHAVIERQTDSTGRFDFPNVAIGQYMLTISQRDFASLSQPVTVQAGYFPFASLVLKPPSSLSEVTVTATRLPVVATVTPITMVGQEDIENTPGATNVNSLAMITDYVPGAYQAHDMLHIRGGHQTNWLIDGIEIPNTNIAENLGPVLNPQDVETLGIERGGYLADEGDRTYGIFNVIPKSGFSRDNQAALDVTGVIRTISHTMRASKAIAAISACRPQSPRSSMTKRMVTAHSPTSSTSRASKTR